jgi:hypothetical protein
LGFRVQGLRFRVQGLGITVWGLDVNFRVWGVGSGSSGSTRSTLQVPRLGSGQYAISNRDFELDGLGYRV